MTPIAFTLLFLFFLFWAYTFVSIIGKEFKNNQVKVFWIIALIFAPPIAVFYYFLKNRL